MAAPFDPERVATAPFINPYLETLDRVQREPLGPGQLTDRARALLVELAVVLNLLSQPKPAVKSTIDQQALARAGIDRLHRLTNRVTPAIEYQPDGSYLQYWPTHSLFETYAMMALLDVSVRRRTLSCEECGAPFVTDSPRARYCGSTCRYRFQKRRQRGSAASDHREV